MKRSFFSLLPCSRVPVHYIMYGAFFFLKGLWFTCCAARSGRPTNAKLLGCLVELVFDVRLDGAVSSGVGDASEEVSAGHLLLAEEGLVGLVPVRAALRPGGARRARARAAGPGQLDAGLLRRVQNVSALVTLNSLLAVRRHERDLVRADLHGEPLVAPPRGGRDGPRPQGSALERALDASQTHDLRHCLWLFVPLLACVGVAPRAC
mmetsp:Transcript_828/g.2247  ORF Transcript_828/g.2247 Transcript_828/m.2247 type:complete len:207 (+) Transcript_828:1466-2086(+)